MQPSGKSSVKIVVTHEPDKELRRPPGAPWTLDKLTLPCPKTGGLSEYCLAGSQLLELNWFKQQYSALFVDSQVVSDAGLHMYTPVDPLFLALGVLDANRCQGKDSPGVFRNEEEVLHCDSSPDWTHVAALVRPQLGLLCDIKEAGGDSYYRLSTAKVLAWLRVKVAKTSAGLCHCGSSFADMDPTARTAYAASLLGEYLTPSWRTLLNDSLGIQVDGGDTASTAPLQPINGASHERPEKRQRVDPKEAARKRAAAAKAETKASELARTAAGSRKIASFFTKPKPKS